MIYERNTLFQIPEKEFSVKIYSQLRRLFVEHQNSLEIRNSDRCQTYETSCQENVCYCINGVAKTYSNGCNINNQHNCDSCLNHYALDKASKTCERIDCCPNGTYFRFCNEKTVFLCDSCDQYYHLEKILGPGDQVQCSKNICQCDNGTPETEFCHVHNSQQCTACSKRYTLNPTTKLCQHNVCTCQNGIPRSTVVSG